MEDIAPACAAGNLVDERDRELIRRWQDHQDVAARNEVVKRYRPLAAKQARIRDGGDDLTHTCLEAMIGALDTFDLTRGTVFATHAVWCIRAALKKHFQQNRSLVTLDRAYMRKWREPPESISLASPVMNEDEDGGGNTFGDQLSDLAAEDERGQLVVERALASLNVLTGRERDLFERRYLSEEGKARASESA
jgi:RNA polymerase sigma factor (sigma-70 family)